MKFDDDEINEKKTKKPLKPAIAKSIFNLTDVKEKIQIGGLKDESERMGHRNSVHDCD
jgi:ATP-dependent Lon protease